MEENNPQFTSSKLFTIEFSIFYKLSTISRTNNTQFYLNFNTSIDVSLSLHYAIDVVVFGRFYNYLGLHFFVVTLFIHKPIANPFIIELIKGKVIK